MAAAPYILARTLREAHTFARETLGLEHGRYRVVNTSGTLKSVRGADLYLVPGWERRFDRFAIQGALRWTRMNVIDRTRVVAEEPEPEPDELYHPEVQLTQVSSDEATAFVTETSNGDVMISEGGPVTIESETKKRRRRSRCKDCGQLHFPEDDCVDDGGD